MKTHANEIFIMYDPSSSKGRQTLAFAHTLSPNIKGWDVAQKPLTPTQWRNLLDMLALRPKDLLDRSKEYYQEHLRGSDLDDEGWLNVLQRNTALLLAPIVVKGDKALLCLNPTDVYSLMQTETVTVA